ncbi:MAG: hypothetical protein GC131_00270 [Alphaproteobacteria bacterium]|nr:hypothetical protein [Alphaproteobacteria bacterium]
MRIGIKSLFKIYSNWVTGCRISKAIDDANLDGDQSWLQYPENKILLNLLIVGFGDKRRKFRPSEHVVTHMIVVANRVWNSNYPENISPIERRMMVFAALAHDAAEDSKRLLERGTPNDTQKETLQLLADYKRTTNIFVETLLPNLTPSDIVEYERKLPILLENLDNPADLNNIAHLQYKIEQMANLNPHKKDTWIFAAIKWADKMANLVDSDLRDILADRQIFDSMDPADIRERVQKIMLNRQIIDLAPIPQAMKDEFFYFSHVLDTKIREQYGQELRKAYATDAEYRAEICPKPVVSDTDRAKWDARLMSTKRNSPRRSCWLCKLPIFSNRI